MPSETLPSLEPGFLRDLHFSTLHDSCVRQAFGEVEVPWWFKTTVEMHRDPMARQVEFRFVTTLEHHVRPVSLGPGIERRVGTRHTRTYGDRFPIVEGVLKEFREKLPEIFKRTFEVYLRGLGPRLYEVDPRIGWRRDTSAGSLPTSEILDPPVLFSRTGVPVADADARGPARVLAPRCSFCDRAHASHDPPVWAGGNLMWVHPECWGGRP